MRIYWFFPVLLGLVVTGFSCGGDISSEGIYRGKLVMVDGSKMVELELLANNKALLRGLFDYVVEGTWEKEAVGEGFLKDDVWAAFQFPSFRIMLKMKTVEEGLVLADLSGRMMGKTILRSMKLKEARPLLHKRIGRN